MTNPRTGICQFLVFWETTRGQQYESEPLASMRLSTRVAIEAVAFMWVLGDEQGTTEQLRP